MARGIRVPIIGDPDSILRAINKTIGASERLGVEMKTVGVKAQESARLQIEASVKKDARLRNEIAVYRQIAAASARGSREQIAAANLATQAENRLARSLSVTAHESNQLGSSAHRAERDLGRATRGALAGSGLFRGLGRSIAFASGGFLAFASAGQLVRSSIDASTEALATQRQLGAQFRASGVDLSLYRKEIEETSGATSELSGFTRDDLIQAFTTAFRGSKNVAVSLREEAIAADVARGRHLGLSQSVIALAKAYGGQVTELRRLGIQVPTSLKGMAALNFVAAKFSGQARAGTTAQQRFGAELHNTEETIGTALLPSLNKYLASSSKWLADSDNQARIQRDVAEGARLVGQGVSGISKALKVARAVLSPVVGLLGGMENATELAGIAFVGLKVKALLAAAGLDVFATSATAAAGAEEVAASRAALLHKRLSALKAIGIIGISVVVGFEVKKEAQRFSKFLGGTGLGQAVGAGDTPAAAVNEQLKKAIAAGAQPLEMQQALEQMLKAEFLPKDVRAAVERALKQVNSQISAGLSKVDFQPGRSSGGAAAPVAAGGTNAAGRLGLKARFAKLELALAQAQLTAGQRDDRKVLQLEVENLKEQIKTRKLSLQERIALTDQLVGVEAQIAAIDKAARDRISEAAKKAREKERAERKKAHDARVRALKEAADEAKKQAQQLRDLIQTERDRIGELFNGPFLNPNEQQRKAALGAPTPGANAKALVADLKGQIRQFEAFERDLKTLAKRGAPQQLLVELRQQGLAVAPEVHALATTGSDTFAQFKRLFVQREKLAVQAAKQERPIINLTVIVNKDTGAVKVKTTPHGQKRGRNPGVVIQHTGLVGH